MCVGVNLKWFQSDSSGVELIWRLLSAGVWSGQVDPARHGSAQVSHVVPWWLNCSFLKTLISCIWVLYFSVRSASISGSSTLQLINRKKEGQRSQHSDNRRRKSSSQHEIIWLKRFFFHLGTFWEAACLSDEKFTDNKHYFNTSLIIFAVFWVQPPSSSVWCYRDSAGPRRLVISSVLCFYSVCMDAHESQCDFQLVK